MAQHGGVIDPVQALRRHNVCGRRYSEPPLLLLLFFYDYVLWEALCLVLSPERWCSVMGLNTGAE